MSEDIRVFDFVEFELAEIAIEKYFHDTQKAWKHLDSLIAEQAYLQTQLAKDLHKEGKLDESGLQQVYSEVDAQLFQYDDTPSVLYRREIQEMVWSAITHFRKAAWADRERRKEAPDVA